MDEPKGIYTRYNDKRAWLPTCIHLNTHTGIRQRKEKSAGKSREEREDGMQGRR